MADIISVLSKMNTTEVAQDKPDSEALWSKTGANINALTDQRNINFNAFTSNGSWVAPANVYFVTVFGIGSGGGGGEGGPNAATTAPTASGNSGASGGDVLFNGSTVAGGGIGGGGGMLKAVPASGVAAFSYGGVGGRGGANGSTGGPSGGPGGGGVYVSGTERGAGGQGGSVSSNNGAGGGGGGSGFHGWKSFAVVPGSSYAVVIGSAGAGGDGGSSGGGGSAGSTGAIIVFYGAN